MTRTRTTASLACVTAIALGLAACGEKTAPEPQNEVTGAAMPDTSQPGPNPPDAGATGVVPPSGSVPVQAEQPQTQTQQNGAGANGQALPPVDMPNVKGR